MPQGRLGFTLLELLVVMGIMVLLMTTGMAGYFGMRRGVEMRGASAMVQNTLMLARQQAVTKRRTVEVQFHTTGVTNSIRVYEIAPGSANTLVHGEVVLPPGIQYEGASVPTPITFVPMGKAGGVGPSYVKLIEKAEGRGGLKRKVKITVWNLTGITKVTES
jgi:prepilin-type N-terminal cleavage/methylation domain-containing protein